jgi:membrane associated rhomboid family serine protease
MTQDPRGEDRLRQPPTLNVPGPILLLVAVFAGVHLWRSLGLGLWEEGDIELLRLMSFVPARLSTALGLSSPQELLARVPVNELRIKSALLQAFVVGQGASLWTLFTSAFLHAGAEHLIVNSLWLVVFGTPVIRRLGGIRFAILFVVSAASGCLLYWAVKPSEIAVLVGASGAISGLTAAAMRFCFSEVGFMLDETASSRPALPLLDMVRRRQPMMFMAVWFGINLIMGVLGPSGFAGGEIAWQAHFGGFLAGMLIFGLLDPVASRR